MLYELIQPHSSVSTVGMCKNAGKTTVLNRIIDECGERGETVALTSIGRDGERSDRVTGTKKPEIYVLAGTLIATAEDALALSDISREILFTTGIPTPMGEVVIVRAMSDGLVEIAGPSMTAQLKTLREKLLAFGARRVFIDGALSRRSLAMPAVTAASVLSTGASYSRDMRKTVEDTAHAARLLMLEGTGRELGACPEAKFCALTAGGESLPAQKAEDAADLIRRDGANALFIRGGVTDLTVEALFSAAKALKGLELICEDGSRLLINAKNYEKLVRAGARITVCERTKLVCVTVNPFSAYGEHYDKNRFFDAVRAAVPSAVPVVDVNGDGEHA